MVVVTDDIVVAVFVVVNVSGRIIFQNTIRFGCVMTGGVVMLLLCCFVMMKMVGGRRGGG